MQQNIVWRYSTGTEPMKMTVELNQVGEHLVYRRLFNGEVVLEKSVSQEQADRYRDALVIGGWRQE